MTRRRTRRWLLLLLPIFLVPLLLCGAGGWWAYRWLHRPPPEPVVVRVLADYPGASAEEVERQIAIPLEVTLAGMPGLETTRSRSSFGRCELRLEFDRRTDYQAARLEVINRL